MHLIAAFTCVTAFTSFSWGVLRFFRKPAGPSPRALALAGLGLGVGIWDTIALADSAVGPWLVSGGVVGHVLAAMLFWSAIRACQAMPLTAIFETDAPMHLVRSGPYRWMRHPFYASYTLFWFSGWIASGSVLSLLGSLAMLAFYVQGAREEERKFAASPLADEYAAYRRQTGLVGPRRTGDQ